MTKLKLFESETGNIYIIDVSEEDAIKAGQDMLFAKQLLHNYKTIIVQNNDELVAETEFSLPSDNDMYHKTEDTMQEESMLSDSSQEKDSFRWPHEAILLLLTVYKEQEDQIISRKMSMNKFWIMIASKLVEKNYIVTGSQCKSKMAGLKRTYKNVKDNYNSKCCNNTRIWRYFDIMDELFKNEPWAAPVLTLHGSNSTSSSEDNIDKKRNSTCSCKTELCVEQCILLEKVLAIEKENSIERRKRHKEAMARQDKFLDILEKIIKKQ